MARPAGKFGEVRQALRDAALQLATTAGVTWRDLASAAKVGWKVAATTVKNMVKAGELVRIGKRSIPGVRRPMALYALAAACPTTPQDRADSAAACIAWWCPN